MIQAILTAANRHEHSVHAHGLECGANIRAVVGICTLTTIAFAPQQKNSLQSWQCGFFLDKLCRFAAC